MNGLRGGEITPAMVFEDVYFRISLVYYLIAEPRLQKLFENSVFTLAHALKPALFYEMAFRVATRRSVARIEQGTGRSLALKTKASRHYASAMAVPTSSQPEQVQNDIHVRSISMVLEYEC